jgi:hypothetical protein
MTLLLLFNKIGCLPFQDLSITNLWTGVPTLSNNPATGNYLLSLHQSSAYRMDVKYAEQN